MKELPLIPAQRAFWMGQQIHPGVPLYNIGLTAEIEGRIDPARFHRAFAALVDEAEVLRMVVRRRPDAVHQVVLPKVANTLQRLDFSNEGDPRTAALDWVRQDQDGLFDLQVCNWRAALIELSESAWIWYLNQHHMFTDATSGALLFERLGSLYGDASGATGAPLTSLSAAYAETEGRDPRPESVDWFAERSVSLAPSLYGRKPAQADTRLVRVVQPLSAETSDRIRAMALEPDFRALSPQMAHYMIFGTALMAFLSRITDAERQCIGAPVHNRMSPAARHAAGLFVEVLPTACEVAPQDTFTAIHGKFRAETTGFLRHAEPGLADPSHQRAINTVFNFVTASFGDFAGVPTRADWWHANEVDPHHHLRLQVEGGTGGQPFRLVFDLNAAVFEDQDRLRVPGHFMAMLEAFIADPDATVGAVPMLSASETAFQAAQLTGPKAAAPALVAARIAETAQAYPARVALRQGDTAVTYDELMARADDLAQVLAAQGARAGQRVGLLLPRGTAFVVAMLACLRSGAAFVPLDPKAPAVRTDALIADMRPVAVLSADGRPGTLRLDKNGAACADAKRVADVPAITRSDPAYVLYTSGSTGTPKGVVISAGAVAHYVGWAAKTYVPTDPLAWALFTPLTFDLTITSLLVPLVTGGEIVVYPEASGPVDTAILDVISEDRVDIVKLTPSHLRLIEDADLSSGRLRQMIVGGEDFPTDLARRIDTASAGRIAQHNEYGPTEATVGCIHHTFRPDLDNGASVPIGMAIRNMAVAVLNPVGQPVPVGVPGELWLGGDGLADGYLGRDDLTEAAFRAPPGGGCRMYRTGDLVRLDPEGVLHYLGRIDQQMKLNGVRVEPGEIEAAFAGLAGLDACVAIAAQADHGSSAPERHCTRCGLPSTYPGAGFDDAGVCHLCTGFERYRAAAEDYFGELDEMLAQMSLRRSAAAPYDCIALLSGGKDSTYMLGRLVDLGLRVLAFTLDNGFISDQAKANIARVVQALGVDHVYGSTPAMDAIFADSLKRNANVCHGCFKTIYSLSMQLARQKGIPYIVTGLSRGQFFETRLTPELFGENPPTCGEIDAMVLHARKAYHRVDDAVSRLLDVSDLQEDAIFEEVEFIDFYRYSDVSMQELYAYLDARLPWVRPSDTGRSTNCLINDVGIHVHKRERGYHNYALPYSWDVRLGHKQRDAAIEELDDEIDEAFVESVLKRIGYRSGSGAGAQALTLYVTGNVDEADLRERAEAHLPVYMRPSRYVRLNALPLSANGKIDRKSLMALHEPASAARAPYVAPRTQEEETLAAIWQEVLKVPRVGVEDDFYDLGGDSIAAIQIVAKANVAGLPFRPSQLFDAPTVAGLAALQSAPERTESAASRRTLRRRPAATQAKLASLIDAIDAGEGRNDR